MEIARLSEMVGGWFVGDFTPSCLRTCDVEIACKRYKTGDTESTHVHKVATEITLVVSGRVLMNERSFIEGDIVILQPGEATNFQALEDTVTLVVKIPSVKGDKFLIHT
jgi:hypothetical protein